MTAQEFFTSINVSYTLLIIAFLLLAGLMLLTDKKHHGISKEK